MTDALNNGFFDEPPRLRFNAWTGAETAPEQLSAERLSWALRNHSPGKMAADEGWREYEEIDNREWRNPQVGWGLVLPERALPNASLATANDAPEAIQRLLAARPGSPVLRWRGSEDGVGELRRFTPDGKVRQPELITEQGIAPWQLPRFLLIFAPPCVIPWAFQYAANLQHCVGRLCLEGEALDNYVDALISDWAGATCDPHAPLLWSVDHGEPDISWLMDGLISRRLWERWRSDKDGDFARGTPLFGGDATRERLTAELARTKPGLIVTTSHGMTGPLNNATAMAAQLGVPVDAAHRALDLTVLGEQWQPDGAIWYAHACCSAGSDTVSAYDGLFDPTSDLARTLKGVAAGCGARIAPLPQQLLGASRPLRAFIGHVEPTFDWTLRSLETEQRLTHSLIDSLSHKLFTAGQRPPIGSAMASVFGDVGTLLSKWMIARAAGDKATPRSLAKALYYQIAALDRQHTVILGDPTVALPSLRATR